MNALKSLVLLVAGLLVVSACGGSGNSAGGGAKRYRIVYIQQNVGNPYFDAITAGFKKASEELGFDFTTTGPASAEATAQIPIIDQQIQKGVDAIAIQVSDPVSELPELQKAKAKGIHIIAVNSDQIPEVRDAALTPIDFSTVPKLQLDLLSELMGGSGDFAILSATQTAPFQDGYINNPTTGVKALLQSNSKYANMHLVKVAYGDDVPQKSTTETEALLAGFPNLKAILAPTTVAVAAAAQAIETKGVQSKIILTGLGTPNQMRKFLKDGTVTKVQLWSPYDQGYVGGYLLFQTLSSKIKPGPNVTFDVPKYGTQTIDKGGVVVVAKELTTFTKENVDSYNF
jgi:rhamnose transport system substrate-binding protein